MTRKCVLCKETNYKNNYSFFSAPKDPQTRKKWQIALGIENYANTDEIYVCSRHFHKNDIITHWVSGVPPQVIKIKYKKCRLRPGAVPGKHFYLGNSSQSLDKYTLNKNEVDMNDFLVLRRKESIDLLKEEKTFVTSKRKKNLNDNEHVKNRNINVCHQIYSKLQDCTYDIEQNLECSNTHLSEDMSKVDINVSAQNLESKELRFKRNESDKMLDYSDICSFKMFAESNAESVDINREKTQILDKQLPTDKLNKAGENIKKCNFSKEDRMSLEIKKHNITSIDSEKSVNGDLKETDLYTKDQDSTALNYDNLNTQSQVVYNINSNDILFEDFLEVYTEVPVPRGWSCLVTSKGHNTTVVYLCMRITKDGFPFMERQVFIRSDMVLHCAVANKEIDPFVHNLVKKNKHIKIRSLLDIEELVDEFDRRVVCQGIYDENDYEDINIAKIAYKDGIKWRHTLCPLIVNNNLSRCTKCAVLFRTLARKSNQTYETEARKYICHSKPKNNLLKIGEELDVEERIKQLSTIDGKPYVNYRLSTESLNKLSSILKLLERTHNFHNFTSETRITIIMLRDMEQMVCMRF